jgi:5'-nucleotidase
MNIFLTNDDGIAAPGLAALREAARAWGRQFVLAPDREYSGCGHQLTTHTPLRLEQLGEDCHVVGGTPADCTRLALRHLYPDIGLVLTGINPGGNLGVDVFTSGTVAAAREAVLLGVPAIAFSQYRCRDVPLDWERSMAWADAMIQRLLPEVLSQPPALWNINFPALPASAAEPEAVRCELDLSPMPVAFRPHAEAGGAPNGGAAALLLYAGTYDQRPRRPGGDVDVCLGGRISITRLHA